MLIYWLFFAFPAMMALSYPAKADRFRASAGQAMALFAFVLAYTLLAGLRVEVGGDWLNYLDLLDEIGSDTLINSFTRSDPIYGLINWVSAQLGLGIYLVNAICGFALAWGVVRIATRFRDPWLAILMSVPYLLIVVGLGYVRQGAAIGMVLLAIASFDRARPLRMLTFLAMAVGFHSTALFTFPLFAYGMARRNKALAVVSSLLGAAAYFVLVIPRMAQFELGYIEAEYDSGGATTRVLMSLVPSLLVLARRKNFVASDRVRSVWVSVALANVIAFVALFATPSSTAVDRIALFFSIIQIAAFGEFRDLVGVSNRMVLLVRLLLIGLAAAVQAVWLVFATHADFWVPYKSIFEAY